MVVTLEQNGKSIILSEAEGVESWSRAKTHASRVTVRRIAKLLGSVVRDAIFRPHLRGAYRD